MDHETTTGQTLVSKYPMLGGTSGRQMLNPGKVLGLIFGSPDAGKSNFLESHPGAFIINMDRTSTSNPQPAATTWPIINSDGVTVDSAGHPIVMTWKGIEEIIDQLVDMATNNVTPRPQTIVFDSLTTAVSLLKLWAPEGLPYASSKGKVWLQLDGKMAWDFIYDRFLFQCDRLKSVGYGVWVVGHTKQESLRSPEGAYIGTKTVPTFTASFFARIFPRFEIITTISKKHEQIMEQYDVEIKVRDKKTIKKKSRAITKIKYILGFQEQGLSEYYKGRARPEIELPAVGAWEVFCKGYLAAAQSRLDSLAGEKS